MMLVLALLLSTGIGVALGLLGGGGSVLATPVLVFVAGVPPAEAIGMSLAIVGVTSATGALLHARTRQVDWRAAAIFATTGVAGAFVGARFTHLVAPRVLLALFGTLLLVVGTLLLLGVARRAAARGAEERRLAPSLAAGLAVGVLTGFLGVGGGFVIVPALLLFGGLGMRRAVGTSLVVIALNSSAGLVVHLGKGEIDLGRTLLFVVFAVAGSVAGHALARRVQPAGLQRAFGVFVILVGGMIAARSLGWLPF